MEDFAEVRIERRDEGGVEIFIKSKKIEELVKSSLSVEAKEKFNSPTAEKYALNTSTNVPTEGSMYPLIKGNRNGVLRLWDNKDLYNSQKLPCDINKGHVDWNYAKYFIASSGVINMGMFQVKGLSEGVSFIETNLIPNSALEKARDNFKDILISLYKQYLKNPKIQLKLTTEELV